MTKDNTLHSFDRLPDSAYVRLATVAGLFACSTTTVWRRVKDGSLPPPTKLFRGIKGWNVGIIRELLRKVKK